MILSDNSNIDVTTGTGGHISSSEIKRFENNNKLIDIISKLIRKLFINKSKWEQS
jgi:hypothetical protein